MVHDLQRVDIERCPSLLSCRYVGGDHDPTVNTIAFGWHPAGGVLRSEHLTSRVGDEAVTGDDHPIRTTLMTATLRPVHDPTSMSMIAGFGTGSSSTQ